MKDDTFEFSEHLSGWDKKKVDEVKQQARLEYKMEGLSPNTYYQVQMYAVNRMGSSTASNSFIFLTGQGLSIITTKSTYYLSLNYDTTGNDIHIYIMDMA